MHGVLFLWQYAGRILEVIGELRQRLLGLLHLQIVEQVAIERTPRTAKDDVFLVGIDVIGKTKPRLPLVFRRACDCGRC